jgi:hypothetical protein
MGIVYLVPGRNNSKDVIFVYPRPWLNTQQFNPSRTPPQMMQIPAQRNDAAARRKMPQPEFRSAAAFFILN